MKRYDTRRGKTTDRGYGWDWQQARDRHLAQHPTCECVRCQDLGRKRPANVVHHIKPVETHPALRLDPGNFHSMNFDCHEVEEGRQRDAEHEDWKRWKRF